MNVLLKLPRMCLLFALVVSIVACARSTPIFEGNFKPGVYTVKRGDTVYSISWRHGQDFRDVIRWNKLSAPYTIYPGQKLAVRGALKPNQTDKRQNSGKSSTANTSSAKSKKTAPPKKNIPAKKNTRSAVKPKPTATNSRWQWPTKGKLLSRFSASAIDRQGIDIKGVKGATVLASLGGKVVYSGSGLRTYGRLIIIKHSEIFLSAYAHNSKLLVKEGDTVKTGQAIARIGLSNQGVAKLHFEIRKNGKPVDPLKYLPTR